MKFKKVILVAACTFGSFAVQANEGQLQLEKSAPVKRIQLEQADFGGYKVQRDMAYVAISQVSADQVILQRNNSSALVKTAKQSNLVNRGSVVKNLLTGSLAPVSGNINVLLNDNVTAAEVSQQLGLAVVVSYPKTKLAVFKVASDADLIESAKALKNSGLVKSARIEVLETIHTAD
ncbi:S8 family serine peptidase [Aliikangiella sp. IMCC44653]